MPETIKGCTTKLQHLKKRLIGSFFDPELSTRVVHMSVVLQKQYLVEKEKNNSERGVSVKAPKIREVVSAITMATAIQRTLIAVMMRVS